MNYHKIDATLAVVLHGASNDDEFDVFIRVTKDFGKKESNFLKIRGVRVGSDSGHIFTAKLSRVLIAEISRQSWVRMISVARILRLT